MFTAAPTCKLPVLIAVGLEDPLNCNSCPAVPVTNEVASTPV